MESLVLAAKDHLLFLRDEHERIARQDLTYIRLAARYGIPTDEISALSGLTIRSVETIVQGVN